MSVYALNKDKKQRMAFDPLKIKVVVEKSAVNALGGMWLNDTIAFVDVEDTAQELAEYTSIDHLIQAQVEHSSMAEPTLHSLLDSISEITRTGFDAVKSKKIEALPQLKTSIEKLSQDIKPLSDKLKEFASTNSAVLKDGASTIRDIFGKDKKTSAESHPLDIDTNKDTPKTNVQTVVADIIEKFTAKTGALDMQVEQAKTQADRIDNLVNTPSKVNTSVDNKESIATTHSINPFNTELYNTLENVNYRSMLLNKDLSFAIIKAYSDQYMAMSYVVEESKLVLIGNGEELINNVSLNSPGFMDIVNTINKGEKIDTVIQQMKQKVSV